MPKAAHDWDICATCSHTINIHTHKDEVSHCGAYECECKQYIKKG